jgi:hypothetical protein
VHRALDQKAEDDVLQPLRLVTSFIPRF